LFIVSVETRFRASHQLDLPDGSKEPLHWHDWSVVADVSSDRLNEMGVVMDFRGLKAAMDSIVAEFNNAQLNGARFFRQNSSSAENVARYVYEQLLPKLASPVKLERIKVVEEPGCAAIFYK
jgi:6-pyruvoyltetrahydropterin/6-carboxytetrahydropterin synthase